MYKYKAINNNKKKNRSTKTSSENNTKTLSLKSKKTKSNSKVRIKNKDGNKINQHNKNSNQSLKTNALKIKSSFASKSSNNSTDTPIHNPSKNHSKSLEKKGINKKPSLAKKQEKNSEIQKRTTKNSSKPSTSPQSSSSKSKTKSQSTTQLGKRKRKSLDKKQIKTSYVKKKDNLKNSVSNQTEENSHKNEEKPKVLPSVAKSRNKSEKTLANKQRDVKQKTETNLKTKDKKTTKTNDKSNKTVTQRTDDYNNELTSKKIKKKSMNRIAGMRKKKHTIKRRRIGGHRVASLNALAKVKVLCETNKLLKVKNEQHGADDATTDEKIDNNHHKMEDKKQNRKEKLSDSRESKSIKSSHNKNDSQTSGPSSSPKSKSNIKRKIDKRKTKSFNDDKKLTSSKKKTIFPKETKTSTTNKKKKKRTIKRKKPMIDPDVEIIDTKRCKRMASLNASAMMAATYLPEKEKRIVLATPLSSPQRYLRTSQNSSSSTIASGQVLVEKHIETTTVKRTTLVKVGHETIVETISTHQFEQEQQNILSSPTILPENTDSIPTTKKRKFRNNQKKSSSLSPSSSNRIKSPNSSAVMDNNYHESSTSTLSASAFTPCSDDSPTGPQSSNNAATNSIDDLVIVTSNEPSTHPKSFESKKSPTILSKRKNSEKSFSQKRTKKQKSNEDEETLNRNNNRKNSIYQKYVRKIETRMESSTTNQTTDIQSGAVRLPNGLMASSFVHNRVVPSSCPVLATTTTTTSIQQEQHGFHHNSSLASNSVSQSSTAHTNSNLFSYNFLNPANVPVHIIPFTPSTSHIQPIGQQLNHGHLTPFNSTTMMTNHANYAAGNTGSFYHPTLNNVTFANQQFATAPISVPFLHPLQPTALGVSYLNAPTNNLYHQAANNHYINVLGRDPMTAITTAATTDSRLQLHRPVPFHPQPSGPSGQQQPKQCTTTSSSVFNPSVAGSLMTPSAISTISNAQPQIINVNGTNQISNLINYSLVRPPQVAIRPLNSFGTQPTFLVQTPFIPQHNFSYTSIPQATGNPTTGLFSSTSSATNTTPNPTSVQPGIFLNNNNVNPSSSIQNPICPMTTSMVNNTVKNNGENVPSNNSHLRQLTNMANNIINNPKNDSATTKTTTNQETTSNNNKNNSKQSIISNQQNNKPNRSNKNVKKSKRIASNGNDLNHVANVNNKRMTLKSNRPKLIQNGFTGRNNLLNSNSNHNNERKKLKPKNNPPTNNEQIRKDAPNGLNVTTTTPTTRISLRNGASKRSNLLMSSNRLINSKNSNETSDSNESKHSSPMNSSVTNDSLVLSTTPSFSNSKKNRKPIVHGWSWEGEPFQKNIYINNDDQSFPRKCYPAIKHNEGEVIRVRDCVLLKSGPRKTDLPFVAKIASLWESPENEMMMSLLWYYRPEHTEIQENFIQGEIYASRHRDTNSVACIDDKCFVLTYNEYCRYKRHKVHQLQSYAYLQPDFTALIVPSGNDSQHEDQKQQNHPQQPTTTSSSSSANLPSSSNDNDDDEDDLIKTNSDESHNRIPPMNTLPELVFFCRKVYDFRQKRILKNPS